ncbi:MAG: sensor histidine kinase [Burkholderiales bacterium]|nr:sensor histidine kinase [Burkholderiales bacterium]
MPDQLVELYEQVAAQVAELDSTLKEILASAGGERARRARTQWDELVALVVRQKEVLDEIGLRTRELASLSAFLQTHYEREKARLARELHDELGGILTPAKMDLSWLEAHLSGDTQYRERMSRLSALIDQGIDLKRRIIEDLRPSLLDHLGLAAAVQWFVDAKCGAAKLESCVTVSKLERLSPDLEIALYRIVQESVNNAVRHSKATRIEITVERTEAGVRLCIHDNGVGIADLERARNQSHGLVGMTHRMRAINGTLDISSRSGEGTSVEAFLPLAA